MMKVFATGAYAAPICGQQTIGSMDAGSTNTPRIGIHFFLLFRDEQLCIP